MSKISQTIPPNCTEISESDIFEDDGGQKTYDSAVANGFYQRETGGLHGKFDNVRRYWEDQITRYTLHDFIAPLGRRKRSALSRVRILDLGAGSGEGYEILTSLSKERDSLASKEIDVLPSEILGCYKGIDLSAAMVEEGRRIYKNTPKIEFEVGDLRKGLGDIMCDAPYDIYFSSFGSLSHLHDEELRKLIEDILDHAQDTCIFVADLIGRLSYEWQCYWNPPAEGDPTMRPYSMSYLYSTDLLGKTEAEQMPLRYWSTEELDGFVTEIAARKGVQIIKKKYWDRSVLVGRHMNTHEFNPHASPIRDAVNRLHEFNQRTDLTTLIFDYSPHPDVPKINEFFERYQVAWNAVVYAAIEALRNWNNESWLRQPPPDSYPDIVKESISVIRNVVRNVRWFRMGDPLANVVEPQLGYILRNLEMDLQQGLGTAHGLLAIYEFKKE